MFTRGLLKLRYLPDKGMISSPASELRRPHFIEPLPEAFSCHLLRGLSGSSTADAEEFAEQFYGFGLQEAAIDVDGVVKAGIGGDVMEGTCVAGFRVGGCVDEA
jgi:hypothetical protein